MVGGYELLGASEVGDCKATTCCTAVYSMLFKDLDGEERLHCILFVLDY